MEKVLKKLRKRLSSIEKQVFDLNVEINKTRAKLAFEKLLDLPSFKGEAKLYISQCFYEGYDEQFYIILNNPLSKKDYNDYFKIIDIDDIEILLKKYTFKAFDFIIDPILISSIKSKTI